MKICNDDVVEIARLTNHIPLLIFCLGGLVPGVPHEDLSKMKAVLEVGCGPGVWMQEFTDANPGIQVTGIDTRPTMVDQARKRLQEPNASALLVSSYTDQLPFNDASFDLVSMHCMSLLLEREKWASLLSECQRVLRSEGLIRVTEFELAQSNAQATEEWSQLCWQALKQLDRCPSESRRYLGWFSELEPMIAASGFQECVCIPHVVNYSYGAPCHQEWKRDLNLQVRKYLPLMVEMHLLTQEQSVSLQERIEQEMNVPSFHAIQHFLTVLGRKIS